MPHERVRKTRYHDNHPADIIALVITIFIVWGLLSLAGPAFDEATSHHTPRDNPTVAPDPPKHPDIQE